MYMLKVENEIGLETNFNVRIGTPFLFCDASCRNSPKRITVSGRDQMAFRSGNSNEHESACLK